MEMFISKKNPDTCTLLFDKTRTAVNASKQWHSYHILFNWDSNVNIFLHCIGMSFLFWKIQMFIVNWEQIWGTRKKHPMASWKCVIFLVRTNVIPMMKQYVFSTSGHRQYLLVVTCMWGRVYLLCPSGRKVVLTK
jgi:hypothetical protein